MEFLYQRFNVWLTIWQKIAIFLCHKIIDKKWHLIDLRKWIDDENPYEERNWIIENHFVRFDDGEAVYSRDGDGVMEINFN